MKKLFIILVIAIGLLYGPSFQPRVKALITIESYKKIQAERQKQKSGTKPNQAQSNAKKQRQSKSSLPEIQNKIIIIDKSKKTAPPKAE